MPPFIMKIAKRRLLLTFFLIITLLSCHRKTPYNIPGTEFVDALLLRDTLILGKYIDTLSLKLMEKYSIPQIKDIEKLHYKLVVSLVSFKQNVPLYKFNVIFPWKENFSIGLIPYKGKWHVPLAYYLNNGFKNISNGDIIYFYPIQVSYDSAEFHFKRLVRFKRALCSNCKNCCHRKLMYVYTPQISPESLFSGSTTGEPEPFYTDGLCISQKPLDTVSLMHALLDKNKYLYPFVEGIYHFYYGHHKSFGIDYGDWVKSEISTGSFSMLGKSIIENIVFYKPMSGPLGYMFVNYLSKNRGLSKKEIYNALFSLTPDEEKIVKNKGDIGIFYRKHIYRFMNMPIDSLFPTVGKFIIKNYNDIKKRRDTIRIIRDKERNITYVISSLYKNGRDISQRFSLWLDSVGFFYKPHYTVLLVPLWLADSFKNTVSPVHTYWVPAYEFKKENVILKELKNAYARFLVSDFIRRYSVEEKQLPLWFSLGVPKFLVCGDNCRVNLEEVLSLKKSDVVSFYENPMRASHPQKGIELSYLMVKLADKLDRGCVLKLMEKSISNLDFRKTYKEVTNHDIHNLIDKWKFFVEDSLYYSVSIK